MGKILGGGSKSTSKPKDMTPLEFKALRKPVAGAVTGLMGTDFVPGGPTYDPSKTNPFDFAVPTTVMENTGVDQIGNVAFGPGFDNAFKVASGALSDTASGKMLTPDSNPFLAGTIEAAIRPVQKWYEDTAIPGLNDKFTLAGQSPGGEGSSPFVTAMLKAHTEAGKQIGDIASTLASQHYDAERSRQLEAATQLPQISGAQLDQSINALQAVALPRLVQQYGSDVGVEEFRRRVSLIMDALKTSAGLSSPQGQIANETTSSTGSNLLGSVLSSYAGRK